MGFLEKIFGNYSEKEIKKILPVVDKINNLESEIEVLTDDELKEKTAEFQDRVQNKGETLDDILVEAFAVVREAAKRTLGMRHFDVQLIGGVVLHQGRISEMKTGEGKTLVATLPAYLNALNGKGLHVITVNEYLAQRDAETMGQVYGFLGLTTGVIVNSLSPEERKIAYGCDITYATNNELGFDYLRDNMVVFKDKMVQRDLAYAIIDEVDSVLIDEARTPLIISGMGENSTKLYSFADMFVRTLTKGRILNEEDALNPLVREELQEEGDFVVDEKTKSVNLTQEGVHKAEKYFKIENLTDPDNMMYLHHINNALRANYNMFLDQNYVVQDGEIVIVDEFTGRLMPGRRYSDGLHQAIEAKEGVEVNKESKTLATVTFQNFFNKYEKKCGMTGTAQTEEAEFRNTYGMDVVVITTNRPLARIDEHDVVYLNERGKFRAVVEDVKKSYEIGQPVLVGTITIEKSEELSKLFKKAGIKHSVLNAKYHEKEAEIVADAGQKGAITIATNMAGRGTDIKLGEGVFELGGLKIIGTERHESRRIDNQLRGRAGRQGDPGCSRFYISMEDDLMRLFGSERTTKVITALGLDENDPIEAGMLTKAIENAQKKVEGNNFAVRKHLLEYDQVMNEQREIIYGERMRVLTGEDVKESILNMAKQVITRICDKIIEELPYAEDWNLGLLAEEFVAYFNMQDAGLSDEEKEKITKPQYIEKIYEKVCELYEEKEKLFDEPARLRDMERNILLKIIDQKWMNHIDDMDRMRQGIGLHAYAQRDPLIEYKYAGYDMFDELSDNIQNDTVKLLFHVQVVSNVERQEQTKLMFTNKDSSGGAKKPVIAKEKVNRNEDCSCGSGKKYKQCCGRNA